MKKITNSFVLFTFLILNAWSQQADNDVFFNISNDTIIFYLDKVGSICTNNKACYIRKSIIDSTSFNYSYFIEDFFSNGEKAYECHYKDAILDGSVKSYFPNGRMKYIGHYKESVKDSVWSYFYDNGQVEKNLHYDSGNPIVLKWFKNNGKELLSNGNGKISSHITVVLGNNEPVDCKITGNLKDGLMEGKWPWSTEYTQGIDYFSKGEYLKSEDYGISAFPVPRVVSLLGFDLHENVNIFKFIAIPKVNPSISNTSISNIPVPFSSSDFESQKSLNGSNSKEGELLYKNNRNLTKTFTQDLSNFLMPLFKEKRITNYWCFIQFVISAKNNLEKIEIHSNNKLISNYLEKYLSSIHDFQTLTKNGQNIPCNIYLSLFLANGTLNIPEYNFNNLGVNILEYLPIEK